MPISPASRGLTSKQLREIIKRSMADLRREKDKQ
jgi:hypothetical protein